MPVSIKRYKLTPNFFSVQEIRQGLVRREHKITQQFLLNEENLGLSIKK